MGYYSIFVPKTKYVILKKDFATKCCIFSLRQVFVGLFHRLFHRAGDSDGDGNSDGNSDGNRDGDGNCDGNRDGDRDGDSDGNRLFSCFCERRF